MQNKCGKSNACSLMVEISEYERPLGRQSRKWMDYIQMNVTGIRWDSMDWINLTQNRDQLSVVVKMVMKLCVKKNDNFLSSCITQEELSSKESVC
jgi:hypothetical protein